MMARFCLWKLMLLMLLASKNVMKATSLQNYGDALSKSILFFEGQRSGKIPSTQWLTWRQDSALRDGFDKGMDLTGGYYDAGDNIKFNFPMAFTTTMLAWGVLEYGKFMGQPDLNHALDAIKWATDYFLKCTANPNVVYAQVGDPIADHNCWERPEDMDTPRTVYAVSPEAPGSEVSAEMASALASASIAFRVSGDTEYSHLLLQRALEVFDFADKYRGSYNSSIGSGVCPFYCDFNGYHDELLWAAAWIYRATKSNYYWNYLLQNTQNFMPQIQYNMLEFGWDAKQAGIWILASRYALNQSMGDSTAFLNYADNFMCSMLPESPTPKSVQFTQGGLICKGNNNCAMQHTTGLSFLILTYAKYVKSYKTVIKCGETNIDLKRLIHFAKKQVDYILGDNPKNFSYMVGYGNNFPKRIHHRGSSIPSIVTLPQHIGCKDGTPYFLSPNPNPNLLYGAVVGGDIGDGFADDREDASQSEPTTYVNAPLVGLLAYFKAHSS